MQAAPGSGEVSHMVSGEPGVSSGLHGVGK